MIKPGLTAFFRTERIQDKILVEQALAEAEIEFQVEKGVGSSLEKLVFG